MKYLIAIVSTLLLSALLVKLFLSKQAPKQKKKLTYMELEAKHKFTPEDGQNAVLYIKDKYGVDMAKRIEQMMRLETGHFTSGQYKVTGSAGMEAGKWQDLPANIQTIPLTDNQDKHVGNFIVWNSVNDFAEYLVKYIQRHNGDWARWNSQDPNAKAEYTARVNSIKPKFV